tara:strand:- start:4124 stop:5287 length:1164 start_codon:yes stop_codon:yes gene_type:complete
MLKIVKGFVTANQNSNGDGRFKALIEDVSDDPVDVIYTSPGYRLNGGGFFFIPEEGDVILACVDTATKEIYYHSTVVDAKIKDIKSKRVPNFTEVPDPDTYSPVGKPVKVKYENQVGAGLCITSNYTSFDNLEEGGEGGQVAPILIDSVSLKSPLKKKISLDDSPQVDLISIKNQHKDGIIITGDSTNTFPAQMVQVKSSGPHNYTCMQSHMDIRVVEGTDITIENNSTGKMGQTPSEDQWPNGSEQQPPKRWGGIYLRSENGDLSVASHALDGRIFITTQNSQIQIQEGEDEGISDIVIKTNGKISMEGEQGIDLRSTGSIRIEAGEDVDIQAGGQFKSTSTGQASISSGEGQVAIDGSEIHLNSGNSTPANFATIIEPLLNDYSD